MAAKKSKPKTLMTYTVTTDKNGELICELNNTGSTHAELLLFSANLGTLVIRLMEKEIA